MMFAVVVKNEPPSQIMTEKWTADQKAHKFRCTCFGRVEENGRRFHMNSKARIAVQEQQKCNLMNDYFSPLKNH